MTTQEQTLLASDDATGNKATARVLIVLARFAGDRQSRGVTELADELGMTKNMVHRALSTLTKHGYLVRDASDTRYELGIGALALGAERLNHLDLPTVCAPAMRAMRDYAGETVTLAVRVTGGTVTIDGVRGTGRVARRIPLGLRTPLHASPSSRVVLASLPDPEIDAYLRRPLERITERTLTDPTKLRQEISGIRQRGYALSFGDFTPGTRGVAFALLDHQHRPAGSLTIGGPADVVSERWLRSALPELQRLADACNRLTQLYNAPALPPMSA